MSPALAERGPTMGFTTHDVVSFAQSLLSLPGVIRVWIEPEDPISAATVWVAVQGFDEDGHSNRINARTVIEEFLQNRAEDMDAAGYLFDYHVLISDAALADPEVPDNAIPLGV